MKTEKTLTATPVNHIVMWLFVQRVAISGTKQQTARLCWTARRVERIWSTNTRQTRATEWERITMVPRGIEDQQRSLGHEYRLGETLDPQAVAEFLPQRKEGARQKVDNPVVLRDYSIENICQITIDGIVYEIE